jgi:hypothetical protein
MRLDWNTVGRWKDHWVGGFLLLLLLVLALMAGALGVGFPLLLVDAVFGLREGWAQSWLLVLAPLWAPIWAGFLAKHLERTSILGERLARRSNPSR